MTLIILAWFLLGLLALGPAAFIYVHGKKSSKKSWPTKVDSNYRPTISILVPTYNESSIIFLKLMNLARLKYPTNLTEIILVDSNSSDNTVETAKQFIQEKPQMNLRILVEKERRGKSHALNYALSQCKGEVVIVSDADCFWPSDILEKAVPFLADPDVGAVGGPKIILNSNETWITRMEQKYLKSANTLRLGESINGSTPFFEGGFSSFKRSSFDRFDPYSTGSDDCGTIIGVIEKNRRAMLVKEAKFYSSFPSSFKAKISIKLRRTNQLVRVFGKYLDLLVKGRVKATKSTVVPNTLLYLLSPIAFVVFLFLTAYLVWSCPLLLISFAFLAIPQVRFYFHQIVENNILLFISIISVLFGKEFTVWSKPEDRAWLTKKNLASYNLI